MEITKTYPAGSNLNLELIDRFENLLLSTNRPGMNNLLEFIRKSDFYSAPASTKYHSCHEGGLLEHSLFVYDCLIAKRANHTWQPILSGIENDTFIIVALLHDICKTYFYTINYKNIKVYSETGSKFDNNGNFDWVTVPFYTINDQYPYGHGEKSVMMIDCYIPLKPIEKYAIRWHMAFSESKDILRTLSAAIKKYPLILAISEADLEATYLLEREE